MKHIEGTAPIDPACDHVTNSGTGGQRHSSALAAWKIDIDLHRWFRCCGMLRGRMLPRSCRVIVSWNMFSRTVKNDVSSHGWWAGDGQLKRLHVGSQITPIVADPVLAKWSNPKSTVHPQVNHVKYTQNGVIQSILHWLISGVHHGFAVSYWYRTERTPFFWSCIVILFHADYLSLIFVDYLTLYHNFLAATYVSLIVASDSLLFTKTTINHHESSLISIVSHYRFRWYSAPLLLIT